ncbi:1-aminocyclopropane-1-carboxylate deaminase/D-cysteine desulfhydrase [Arenicella xantha]|uniref:1-aminocyclopropane-1-carboxylate deaminase/D-cysteine desulfhydrase-like pyridoxal-dependent ACC family enzyme n=1 Tax=Arenicella xantha TaxID=644221 RepID=A0A395JG36_9GAMM|nr:pyridoxal-phosphate dependent enzyme [Arenicella xantha]RBP48742.1 1-aminocyclopropane-1-carboxylate deaminase/D-cysteine desulfhydrase-like pyridoxal-dependent ACC family enzyme [Arenicella xantha]
MEFNSISIAEIPLIVARDDLNHRAVSGNKLHKLTPNIELAKAGNYSTILSFGGPYSNHLHALAWACKESGLASIGVVRGELHANLTDTLKDCQAWGMRLFASQRKEYREYQQALALGLALKFANSSSIASLSEQLEDTLILPEGGSNLIAIESLSKAYAEVFSLPHCSGITHAVCATGTGATLAGLYKAAPRRIKVIGIQAVAESDATLKRIHGWLGEKPLNLSIEPGHLGGFGKIPTELVRFVEEFEANFNVPLDPIYNGKVMYKLSQMIAAGYFKKTDKVLVMHTGGLQGKRGS